MAKMAAMKNVLSPISEAIMATRLLAKEDTEGNILNTVQGSYPKGVTRRALLSVAFVPVFLRKKACASESLLQQAKRVEYGLVDGSIRPCPSNVNPNCVSTSSIGFDSYAPPWRSLGGSVDEVAEEIIKVMPTTNKDTVLLVSEEVPGDGRYLRFKVAGRLGDDIVEFLIRHDEAASVDSSGDSSAPLIFFRSIARNVKYIYPITQPISDLGAQRNRMGRVLELLKFRQIGCDLIECYQSIHLGDDCDTAKPAAVHPSLQLDHQAALQSRDTQRPAELPAQQLPCPYIAQGCLPDHPNRTPSRIFQYYLLGSASGDGFIFDLIPSGLIHADLRPHSAGHWSSNLLLAPVFVVQISRRNRIGALDRRPIGQHYFPAHPSTDRPSRVGPEKTSTGPRSECLTSTLCNADWWPRQSPSDHGRTCISSLEDTDP